MSKDIHPAAEAVRLRAEARQRDNERLQAQLAPDIGFIIDAINHAMEKDSDDKGYWHIRIYKRDIKYKEWQIVIKEAIVLLRSKQYYVDEPSPQSAILSKNSSYIISFKPVI